MTWLPRSLFRRLVLVFLVVLVTAQLLGLAIHLQERSELMREASGMQAARRVVDIVRLLDSLLPEERMRVIAVLSTPGLRVRLDGPPEPAPAQSADQSARAVMFSAFLQRLLGDARPFEVSMTNVRPRGTGPAGGPGSSMGSGTMPALDGHAAMFAMKKAGVGPSFLVQTQLADGTRIVFDARLPQAAGDWPLRMFLSLALVLVSVLIVSLVAVRWVTRPLDVLADAADELGRNINRPPLSESGPAEVVRAARAFNTMQARLSHYLQDRTRFLAAMSHDLKTPITRLRLRAELLDDPALRAKFTADLTEMESMVQATLDFMRGVDADEKPAMIDVPSLLESLQADLRECGGDVQVDASRVRPYVGRPQALKRCLMNLMHNAIQYGGSAQVTATDRTDCLEIRVRDSGPGIPEDDLERVFEPYLRLENSRNRDTGGTGLGLAIARSIARTHGGDVQLHNLATGGLEAVVRLPRAV